MSDTYQHIGIDRFDPASAERTVELALNWLVQRRYIMEGLSDCAYGPKDGLAHLPGPNWREVIQNPEAQARLDAENARRSAEWSARTGKLAKPFLEVSGFPATYPCGVHASAGREVIHAGGNYDPDLQGECPVCAAKMNWQENYIDLISRWHEGAETRLECATCRANSRLEDWDWQPGWAFGLASVTFWNWPELSRNFIDELSLVLGGARLRRVFARL